MSLLNQFQEYLEKEKYLVETTVKRYLRTAERLRQFFPNDQLQYLDTEKIQLFILSLNMSARSKRRILSALKHFYMWLRNKRIIDANPTDSITIPKMPRKLPKPLSKREINEILSKATNVRLRSIVELLYGCGLRISELANLNIEDINFDNRTILVHGKGGVDRYVPMYKLCHDAIRLYINKRESGPLIIGANRYSKRQRMTSRSLRRIIKDRFGVNPHRFRHTFATHLLEAGADIMVVNRLLGHKSVETTMVYLNISMQHIRDSFIENHPRARLTDGELPAPPASPSLQNPLY